MLITGGYFIAQPDRCASTTINFIDDQQQLSRIHQTQYLTSIYYDHESRSLSSVFIKSHQTHTFITTPAKTEFSQNIDYSGWQLYSPATNHTGKYRASKFNISIYYTISYKISIQNTNSEND